MTISEKDVEQLLVGVARMNESLVQCLLACMQQQR